MSFSFDLWQSLAVGCRIMEANQETGPSVSISLTVNNVEEALGFYRSAFGIEELFRLPMPDKTIAHAEFMLGECHMYISCESPEWQAYAIPKEGKASCLFAIATDDCDAAFATAVEAGGGVVFEPTDQFWGVRNAMIVDPYGYRWSMNQKTEEVSPMDMMRRARKFYSGK